MLEHIVQSYRFPGWTDARQGDLTLALAYIVMFLPQLRTCGKNGIWTYNWTYFLVTLQQLSPTSVEIEIRSLQGWCAFKHYFLDTEERSLFILLIDLQHSNDMIKVLWWPYGDFTHRQSSSALCMWWTWGCVTVSMAALCSLVQYFEFRMAHYHMHMYMHTLASTSEY